MNNSPYSYDEILAMIDLAVGLERHTRLDPEAAHIRILGINQTQRILGMTHPERIVLIKEVVAFL
jgi:hypothetical protein